MLDALRIIVLMQITAVFVLSTASLVYYVRRMWAGADSNLSWHVLIIATVFLDLLAGEFVWVLGRFGKEDFNPWIINLLIVCAAAIAAQVFLYRRQIMKLRLGE